MIWQQTLERIGKMKMYGMLKALEEQEGNESYGGMVFEDRLGHTIEMEYLERENRKLTRRIRSARLRQQACVEDIKFGAERNLSKTKILDLAKCGWIKSHQNMIITGPTGAGKSYLACALGHSACLSGYSVQYARVTRFLMELAVGRGDGSYEKLMKSILRADLLVLDDFGLAVLGNEARQDLLEVVEDRHELRSTAIVSQLPVDKWHEIVGNSTVADAILDRVVHGAHRINLKANDSMRKKKNNTGGPREA